MAAAVIANGLPTSTLHFFQRNRTHSSELGTWLPRIHFSGWPTARCGHVTKFFLVNSKTVEVFWQRWEAFSSQMLAHAVCPLPSWLKGMWVWRLAFKQLFWPLRQLNGKKA